MKGEIEMRRSKKQKLNIKNWLMGIIASNPINVDGDKLIVPNEDYLIEVIDGSITIKSKKKAIDINTVKPILPVKDGELQYINQNVKDDLDNYMARYTHFKIEIPEFNKDLDFTITYYCTAYVPNLGYVLAEEKYKSDNIWFINWANEIRNHPDNAYEFNPEDLIGVDITADVFVSNGVADIFLNEPNFARLMDMRIQGIKEDSKEWYIPFKSRKREIK